MCALNRQERTGHVLWWATSPEDQSDLEMYDVDLTKFAANGAAPLPVADTEGFVVRCVGCVSAKAVDPADRAGRNRQLPADRTRDESRIRAVRGLDRGPRFDHR